MGWVGLGHNGYQITLRLCLVFTFIYAYLHLGSYYLVPSTYLPIYLDSRGVAELLIVIGDVTRRDATYAPSVRNNLYIDHLFV